MSRVGICVALLMLGIVLAASHMALAQHGTSVLSGVVLNADGTPAANASVIMQSGGGVAPHVVRTDARGRFSVPKLRADIYDVRASLQGVYSDWQKNVSLKTGQTKTLTLRLTHAKDPPPNAPPVSKP
jgi:hypothetical protein